MARLAVKREHAASVSVIRSDKKTVQCVLLLLRCPFWCVQAVDVAALNVVIEQISERLSRTRGEDCLDPVKHDDGVIRTSHLHWAFVWVIL